MRPRIEGAELLRDLDALARIGADANGGVSRIAFSEADREGRAWVNQRLRDTGLSLTIDAAGNSIGTYPGREQLPPIALGSHTDTVPNGGRYDGALGVLAGLACARALQDAGVQLRHPLEVINFQSEESFVTGTLGSAAMAGLLTPDVLERAADDGRTAAEHIRAAGLDPAGFLAAGRPAGSLTAYLELHVEQGGILAAERIPVGVVEGIVGIRRYRATFPGFANHAGTTPMAQRDDALVKAAPFILAVRDVAVEHGIVGTIGTLSLVPGASNVIPGEVSMSVEIRGMDEVVLDAAEHELAELAMTGGGELERRSGRGKGAVRCDPRLVSLIEEACREAGFGVLRMSSGAGHDAMTIATIAPMAMLFAPSLGGISHSPDEYTDPEHCVIAADALLASLLKIDESFDGGGGAA